MLVVGLTGAIGSGKSTVARLLADRGAVVIDADAIAREVVEPDGPAYAGVVEHFGPGVVLEDGSLDRPALAALVFSDGEALSNLNRLTHPHVGQVMSERLAAHAQTPDVVVLDIPLLAEGGGRDRYGLAAVIVVDAEPDVALRRLIEQRRMDPADAKARMANQASRQDRLAQADVVIDNSGTLEDLSTQTERAWKYLTSLASGDVPPG
ncbi:MAG: dephospho-CoA kinase [Acidimicrobiales bacterium]